MTGPGLCGVCAHSRHIAGKRNSRFWLCERSRADARYSRYPRLPVFECPGFEPKPAADRGPEPDREDGQFRQDREEK
jgi:hypothetical protein